MDKAGDALVNADPHYPLSKGRIPGVLMFAAENGTFAEWEMVLKHVKNDDVYRCKQEAINRTLLHLASGNKAGGLEIATFLVENKKLDVNALDAGSRTALFGACAKVTEYLVSKGLDVNDAREP